MRLSQFYEEKVMTRKKSYFFEKKKSDYKNKVVIFMRKKSYYEGKKYNIWIKTYISRGMLTDC